MSPTSSAVRFEWGHDATLSRSRFTFRAQGHGPSARGRVLRPCDFGPRFGHTARSRDDAGRPQPLGEDPGTGTGRWADGPTLYDSRVITRYLDETLRAGLYPSALRLWDTLVLEATADGIADAAILMRYEDHVRPTASRSPVWTTAQWQKVTRALDAVEGSWMSHLAGPPDMGQIALGAALGYLDYRHVGRDWRATRPAFAAWWAAFSDRPSLRLTMPV